MKRLVLAALLLILITLLIAQAQAQTPTYKWGLPQTVQTNVIQPAPNPFPDISPRQHRPVLSPRISEAATRPLPQIRKVAWPTYRPVYLPPAPTPLISPVQSSMFRAEARILWQKTDLSFHKDGPTFRMSDKATGQFGVSFIDPKLAKIQYKFTMETKGTDSFVPATSVLINNVEYGRPATAPSGTVLADTTPIDTAWSIGLSHMLTLTCLRFNTQPGNFWLSPVFVSDFQSGSLTGTKNTLPVPTATENFSQFFPAGGLELSYNYPNAYLTLMGAASNRYWVVDVAYKWAAVNGLGLGIGWTGKKLTFDKDISVQTNSPYAEVFWQF